MGKIGTLDLEALKKQSGNLSQEQEEEIARQALEEMTPDPEKADKKEEELVEEEVKKKSDDEQVEEKSEESDEKKLSDEELLKAEDSGLTDEQKAKKAELVASNEKKAKEDEERILNAKEEELSPEDKTKKADILKVREEAKQKAFDEEVKSLAEKEGLSEEDARKELESAIKIQEKYNADPKQLARANLHLQRMHSKSEAELKKIQQHIMETRKVTIDDTIQAIDNGKIKIKGKPATREEIISAYRDQEPKLTDNADDETVLKLAAKAIKESYEKKVEQEMAEEKENTSKQANEKRSQLLKTINEADKEFIPDIKPLLDKIADSHVMNEEFSLGELILWAKGKRYDALKKQLKEVEEKGYKRGLEQAKIVGVKNSIVQGSGSTKQATKKSASQVLTAQQKERAMSMYGYNMSEEEAYEAYLEYIKSEKK